MQVLCMLGLYEAFKGRYSVLMGEEAAYLWRTSLYMMASTSAQFFADALSLPLEAVKIRLKKDPGYAGSLREAIPRMFAEEGLGAFYKGVLPLWAHQMPYTMMKFVAFERAIEALYLRAMPKPQNRCSSAEQLTVTFSAGYVAGVFCAIVYQPADKILTALNEEKGTRTLAVLQRLGFWGLWRGSASRILMVGAVTALQWFTYDAVKMYFRIPPSPVPSMPESLRIKLNQ
ncbi:phosphate carrier protein, mitochondrial-like [Monodelphis domestica]|uniref:phosphate carrier protein, mitochondrial-like n=1 Tax=Monodelphis domestica TaxID=13616 RepID=UPI0000F2E7E8|nr:phosphate carrier protein, mitochondrial-like [Monodelphis domestica]